MNNGDSVLCQLCIFNGGGECSCGDDDDDDDDDDGGCNTGDDCGSGICVNSACRSSCSSYPGYGCSTDGNDWYSDTAGTCLSDGVCQYGEPIAMDCPSGDCQLGVNAAYDGSVCDGTTGYACDSTSGGNFVQNGICSTTYEGNPYCDGGYVRLDNAQSPYIYQDSCAPNNVMALGAKCDIGNYLDSDGSWSGGNWQEEGTCCRAGMFGPQACHNDNDEVPSDFICG